MIAGVAPTVAAADFVHKAVAIAECGDELLYHERSLAYALGVPAGALAWSAALVTRALGLAFNDPDVAAAASALVVLPVSVAVFAARNRDRLRERVSFRG